MRVSPTAPRRSWNRTVILSSKTALALSCGPRTPRATPARYLSLLDTGQLSVVSSSGVPLWAGPGELVPGASLSANQSLSDPSGAYHLVMQGDGNLGEYNSSATAVWAASTNPNGSFAVMQSDGNFVVYMSAPRPAPRGPLAPRATPTPTSACSAPAS